MSTLGKIVTVFIVIAAVAVGAMVVTFVQRSEDWHKIADRQADELGKAVGGLESLRAAVAARNTDIANLRQAFLAKIDTQNQTIGRLNNDKKTLQDTQREQGTKLGNLDTSLQKLQVALGEAQKEKGNWKTAYDQVDTKAKQLLDDNQSLTRKTQDMRRLLDDLRAKSRLLEVQNREITKRLTFLEQNWPGGEVPTGDVPALPTVDLAGLIKDVDNVRKVAEITLGSSDKVVEGMTFMVSRGGTYLADLVVTRVDENSAVGKLETVKHEIQEGDNVTYYVRH